jgi:hypothetical protein
MVVTAMLRYTQATAATANFFQILPSRHWGILRHQTLQFSLGLLMFEVRRTGPREGSRKLCPGIGGAHVNDADRLRH